jgi:hypothetical protein
MIERKRLVKPHQNPGQFEFGLDDEAKQHLLILHANYSWRLYRQFLIDQKVSVLEQAMGLKDPNEVMKQMGIAAGLNLAVNQLDVLVYEINKEAKRGAGATE